MRSRRGGGSRGARLGFEQDHENADLFGDPSTKVASKNGLVETAQIEYLIEQSSLGVHFLFSKRDVARVMMIPTDEREFFTLKNMERVQRLLTSFLERPSLMAKERYLKSLGTMDRDLLIRAYFHLVENTILSNVKLKH